MKKKIESSIANVDDATVVALVGSVSKSSMNEMLVHKKLDKIDRNLTQIAINTNKKENNQCAVPEDVWPVLLFQVQTSSRDGKSRKFIRFAHFSNEIRDGNMKLHNMSKGLVMIKELWTENSVGMNRGPALRQLELDHDSKWRNDKRNCGGTTWSRRLTTFQEVETMIADGIEEDTAVSQLDTELGLWSESKGTLDVVGFNRFLRNRRNNSQHDCY